MNGWMINIAVPVIALLAATGVFFFVATRGTLLVRVGSAPDLAIKQQQAPGADATDAGSLSHSLLDNLNDATLAAGFGVALAIAVLGILLSAIALRGRLQRT